MKPVECEFESDALAAALQCRWPGRVDAHLRAHVLECAICSDVVAIAKAVDDAREEVRAHATVPDSGRVWWVAQLRARREAVQAAGRPITGAQVIAFASAVGLLGAFAGAMSTRVQWMLKWIASSVGSFDVKAILSSTISLLAQHSALVLAMAAVLFVVPAAVYLAMGKD